MSSPITVTFMLADWIVKGLANGTLERVGGVIRDKGTKRIVTWLIDVSPSVIHTLNPINGILNLVASGANTAISIKGFSDVNKRLHGIEQKLDNIEQTLQIAQKVLHINSAVNVLNLGVSVMGFAVIAFLSLVKYSNKNV